MQTASPIPPAPMLDRKRLAAVLELIGSDKPGERQAAAEAAHRLVQAAGLRWDDLLRPPEGPPTARKPPTVRDMAATLARHPDQLTEWELGFVASVSRQRRVSRKQFAILARLAGRVRP